MKYYGMHWTSDDGTELQIRLDLLNLELGARSCPRGGEWTAWRRLDVLRGSDGVLEETVRNARHADSANTAQNANKALLATRALNADNALHANSADAATRADRAGYADKAAKADEAAKAQSAATADKLGKAVTIQISGAVTGSSTFDGKNNVNIVTSPGSDMAALQEALKNLGNRLDSLNSGISGANGEISSLKARLDGLEKKLAALEEKIANGNQNDVDELLHKVMLKVYENHCYQQDQGSGYTLSWDEFWGS